MENDCNIYNLDDTDDCPEDDEISKIIVSNVPSFTNENDE